MGHGVKFPAYLTSQGKPQAKDLLSGLKGNLKGEYANKGGRDDAGGELGQFVGTIKSFNDMSGYGFIDCPEIKEMG